MTEAEQERAALVEYARHLAQINHRSAVENAELRTEYIALSSAYRPLPTPSSEATISGRNEGEPELR